MGKMTAEKAAKMLAEEGIVVSQEEAAQIVEFLRTLARMTVTQHLREDGDSPAPDKEDRDSKTP